ncbi:MAG: HEAT repeat domain-containing protein [Nitrospinae bacterium]|nr:HEAT repeat domain-containing protein [Nitrospinota bacterium]
MPEENTSRFQTILIWGVGVAVLAMFASIIYFTSSGFLTSMLSSTDVRHRRWAADELVRQGASAGIPSLNVANDATADPESRRLAIFVLGEIKYKEALPQLLTFFKGDNVTLREQSAYALGRIGDQSVVGSLLDGYETAPKGVKIKILAALGELGSKDGVPLLKMESDTSQDETIKEAAAYSLQKLTDTLKGSIPGGR